MLVNIIVCGSLLGGFFFLLVGVIGLFRLPDVFSRMHAMGKCDTLGTGMILFALLFLVPGLTAGVKIVLMGLIIATINPVMAHLIARAAYDKHPEIVQNNWTIDNYRRVKNGNSQGE